jgi:hypothetical protein
MRKFPRNVAPYIFKKDVSQDGKVTCYIELGRGSETGHESVRARDDVKEDGVVKTSNLSKLGSFGIKRAVDVTRGAPSAPPDTTVGELSGRLGQRFLQVLPYFFFFQINADGFLLIFHGYRYVYLVVI